MATATFKIGDIVQLKSGGPKMTVTHHTALDPEVVHAMWFAGSKREAGAFPIKALVPIADEPAK